MKIFTTLLLVVVISQITLGQTDFETIKKAKDLIVDKKYESAYKLLDNFDQKNTNPDIVLLKEDIVLNYFVSSIMHQMFALKDINQNEDIMDYRGKEGQFSMLLFQIDSILTNLIRTNPNNCKLYKGLGEYYYEVHLKYGSEWLKDENELFTLIETNYKKAIERNCFDYMSYYALGEISILEKKYKDAIPYYLKSINLKKDNADSYYNLAYAYLFTDDQLNALKYAKISFDLFSDKSYKSDAARMLGQIYTELQDNNNALINYELANVIDSGNYNNIKPLLNLYIKTANKKTAETTTTFFNLAPTNPTIYNDLEEIYYSYKKENDLITFYKSQFTIFSNNNKVQGNLNFYLAKLYLDTDKNLAKEYFIKAKEIFTNVYDKDHAVFHAIDEGIKQTEK